MAADAHADDVGAKATIHRELAMAEVRVAPIDQIARMDVIQRQGTGRDVFTNETIAAIRRAESAGSHPTIRGCCRRSPRARSPHWGTRCRRARQDPASAPGRRRAGRGGTPKGGTAGKAAKSTATCETFTLYCDTRLGSAFKNTTNRLPSAVGFIRCAVQLQEQILLTITRVTLTVLRWGRHWRW